ncbi:hypothetical protein J3F83DRAFT_753022 [Trichoderma novae-zelandiae]
MIAAIASATRPQGEPSSRCQALKGAGAHPAALRSLIPRRCSHLVTIHNCRQQGFRLETRRFRRAAVRIGNSAGHVRPPRLPPCRRFEAR